MDKWIVYYCYAMEWPMNFHIFNSLEEAENFVKDQGEGDWPWHIRVGESHG